MPEPELAYLFKHIVTQEVAYTSLPAAMRAALHERFAAYLEDLGDGAMEQILDLLAYHYERSDNLPKKREYLRLAGVAAAERYANVAAIDYLSRALTLTPADDRTERYALLLARCAVYELHDPQAMAQDLDALGALAEELDDDTKRAEVAIYWSDYVNMMDDDTRALAEAARALALAPQTPTLALRAHLALTWPLRHRHAYAEAQAHAMTALNLARATGDRQKEARVLSSLGLIAAEQRQYSAAQALLEQSQTDRPRVRRPRL